MTLEIKKGLKHLKYDVLQLIGKYEVRSLKLAA